jgi:N-acyl-D-aspartate/D-glutamate deacylase
MCEETGAHEGTTLEGIVAGCLDRFSDEEIELLSSLSAAADRPLNWNVLTVDAREPDRVPRQLGAGDRARDLGGRLVALTMPVGVPMNMSFLTYCALWLMPGWAEIMARPVPERIAALSDPDTRIWMLERSLSPEAGVFRRLADWGDYRLGDVYAPQNQALRGRTVGDIAAERGKSSFGTLLDIVIADELRTVLWPVPRDDDAASWELRRHVWEDDGALLGGSDAGAHLDRMCGAPYTTRFLADCLRGRRLVPLERAVQLITAAPAALFGLRDRGVLRAGAIADVVVFDPETVDADDATLVRDLPGDAPRLTAGSRGVVRVLVNGVTIVEDGVFTGATPGTVLRSGRDTHTVSAR